MRVGIDTSFAVERSTGIGVYARLLAENVGAAAPGDNFVLYGGDVRAGAANIGVRHVHPSKGWRYAADLARQLAVDRIDLFHAVANFLAPIWSPCPLVVTVHDLIPFTHPDTVSRKHAFLARAWTPLTLRRARRVICVSDTTAADVTSQWPSVASRIRVVKNGVRLLPVDPSALASVRARYQLPEEFVVAVAAIEPRKNFALLADVWREHGSALPPLVVAGQRWHDADAIERSAGGAIRFLGYVPDADLGPLLSAAALFVFPSRAEGFGYPPLEAMRLGIAVVAARAGALPEVLGDGAILLPPDDREAWFSEIARLIADRGKRAALAERGRAIADAYSVERCARETVVVYEEAARDARSF